MNPHESVSVGELKVTVPDKYTGDVMGDLNKRRGRVLGMNKVGSYQIVDCEIPEAEIITYNIDLKAMTQGDGTFTREFVRYEEVPQNVADKVIEQAKLLQNIRNAVGGIFDNFFAFITNISVDYYIMAIPLIIYWAIDKKKGKYIFLLSFVNLLLSFIVTK